MSPPLYDYKCESCGFSFEIKQGIDEEPLKKCTDENCEGKLNKVFGSSSTIWKTGGFKEGYGKKK